MMMEETETERRNMMTSIHELEQDTEVGSCLGVKKHGSCTIPFSIKVLMEVD